MNMLGPRDIYEALCQIGVKLYIKTLLHILYIGRSEMAAFNSKF